MEGTMNNYSIALFLHIAGALGFFVVLGLEWVGLAQIRKARQPEEAHAILRVVNSTNRLGSICMPATIITGFYMMLTVWGGAAWLLVTLGALVLEIVFFVTLTMPRMKAVEQALAKEKSPLSQTFHDLVNHPILWISIQTRVAIVLGLIFLKIAKPDLGGSLLAMGVAIGLGLASTLPVLRRERIQKRPAIRIIIAIFVTAFVAALALLAANSISASTTPISEATSNMSDAITEPIPTQTRVDSANLSTEVPTPSTETALQEGLSILQTRCTQCHQLQWIQQHHKSRTEWEKTLSKMESFNVKISDTEKTVLLDYLSSESLKGEPK